MTVMRMRVDDASEAFVEVDVPAGTGDVELLGRGRDGTSIAAASLAGALDRVVPALSMVLAKLQAVDPAVDEIAVNVGLRVGGETGLLLVRGTAEATFDVTMTWRRPAPTSPADDASGPGQDDGGVG
jgi:NTP-dependent ternary system trypsin peptidase co-occuring protein